MKRRRFVKTASSAALGLIAARAPLFAKGSPSEKVVVCVMGLNGRGTVLAKTFAKTANAEVAAVCDVDSTVLAKAATTFGVKGIADFRRALDDKSIDALVIAAPDHWHAPAAILAMSAGKHVYLEKPCGHNAREGELLVEALNPLAIEVSLAVQRELQSRIEEADCLRHKQVERAQYEADLAQRRYHCFVINTRGHDWIARVGNLTKFGGSAYENLEDCLLDFDGALDYLHKQGYRRFVLVGHSLGAIKSIIYQGTRQRADVVSIVSCSAPKQFYSERVSRQPGFRETIEKAETMVAEGRGEELLSIAVGATPGIFSARTHLDKYCRDDRNDCRPYAKRIGCPLLAIVGRLLILRIAGLRVLLIALALLLALVLLAFARFAVLVRCVLLLLLCVGRLLHAGQQILHRFLHLAQQTLAVRGCF